MALEPKISNASASAAADAVTARLNNGFLDIYDGAKPATADTAITTQVKLARLSFGSPAYAAAVDGVAAANAIASDTTADASGTATWFRSVTSAGASVWDGTVGTSAANLNLNSVAISAGAQVSVTSLTYTQPKG